MNALEELKKIGKGYDYYCYEHRGGYDNYVDIKEMEGKTFDTVIEDGMYIIFMSKDEAYLFFHFQECCESVEIDDICGELSDLAGVPLLKTEEVCNESEDKPRDKYDDSFTWTFYKFATTKGYVDIRWYGTSNGYYSESVDLYCFPIKDGQLIRKQK